VTIWVKICGITGEADAAAAVAAGADAIGFIFAPRSKRYVDPAVAARIASKVPARVMRVGVFVDAPVYMVRKIREQVGLSLVQLHGRETPATAAALGNVVKVFRRGVPLAKASAFPDAIAMFDGPEGGSGQLADWSVARQCARLRQVILAGGLTPANVCEAINAVHPWGVDVSSGVELSPGVKDHDRVRAFIAAARAA